ncbi:acyl-CoA dehydrogenase family protein [Actinomadura soli]|uniref:Acyl-CoA dehydrogenase family protein n=1 Tax=Actinomadura soli TaxID=2508997 RepID=A0A5C4J358_9ACTN|nr:acyl-CoA dehydrogenase family protein [Actinomadura soli]TMQ91198.1 acyl-CoA dehydrogenase family protein [Actinomadura soli]
MKRTLAPTRPVAVRIAEEFDRFLGDPLDPTSRLSLRTIMRGDEAAELPDAVTEAMGEWGYAAHLVPRDLGGALGSPETLLTLCRTLSRRSMTVAVAFGSTFLGANPIWLWGDDEQKAFVADQILQGSFGGLALSESEHGSDLIATSTTALPTPGGHVLHGTKWPVGNASRGSFLVVLARTRAQPRQLGLFLVNKSRLDPATWYNEPSIPTLGLRGHDVSGITFRDCAVPASATVGDVSDGLGHTVKALQITKAFVAGLSLGAGDSALRFALDYSRERRLYGQNVYALPIIRHQLVEAYTDLLIAECVAAPVARSVSLAPERLPLWASVSKYIVPLLVDDVVRGTSEVLGARSYIRNGVYDGAFQKLQRDHAIAGIFEGTKQVNLHMIANQLPDVRRLALGGASTTGGTPALFEALFSRVADAPDWKPDGDDLRMTNRGLDEFSQGWPATADEIHRLATLADAPTGLRAIGAAVDRLTGEWQLLWSDIERVMDSGDLVSDPEGFHLAHRYCLLFAAAACANTWLVNRHALDGSFHRGEWLAACLQRTLVRLGALRYVSYGPEVERMMLNYGVAGNAAG